MTRPARVLFLTSPGIGHVFSVVPSLWAARGTGAQVLVGATGAALGAATGAGLPAVDLCPGLDLGPLRAGFLRRMPGTEHSRRFAIAMEMFAAIADAMVDGAVRLARDWRPDVVLFTPLQAAGPLVAEVLDVPCIEHGFQLTGVGQTQHLLEPHLGAAMARAGVSRLRPADVALDVCPPSVLTGPPQGRVMGYLPFNGGSEVSPDLLRAGSRPRVLVTTGTAFGDEDARRKLLETLGGLDVDVLLAGERPEGRLPANVTAPGWIPLDTVLPTAAALVHHGGAGSVLAALRAGVAQVVVSEGADHDFNAAALTRRGAGLSGVADVGAAVHAALEDPAITLAAQEVAAEMAALPAPAAVIPEVLADLVGPLRADARQEVGA